MKIKLETLKKIGNGVVIFAGLDGYRRSILNDEVNKKLNEVEKVRNEAETLKNEAVGIYEEAIEEINNNLEKNNEFIKTYKEMIANNEKLKKIVENAKEKFQTVEGLGNTEENGITDVIKQNLNKDITSLAEECINTLNEQKELIIKSSNILQEVFKSDINKFNKSLLDWFSQNFFPNIWPDFSSLNTHQLGAIGHIAASIFVLLCLFSLVSVFYGERLINYFNLENKYPKLAKYIQIRRKFQHYYFLLNVILIIIVLFYVIYINLTVLYITSV